MKTKDLQFLTILCLTFILCIMSNPTTNAQSEVAEAKIEIKNIEAQKALTFNAECSMAEISTVMGEGYQKLFAFMEQKGIVPAGPPFSVYYSWDEETGRTNFDMGVPVSTKSTESADIKFKEFPSMKVASRLWVGPYDQMEQVYVSLQKYLEENNLESTGTAWDIYLSDPMQEKDPNKYQTIVYFPIKE